MDQPIPAVCKAWTVEGFTGFECMKFGEQKVPELGDNQVLVKIRGASLNFRDIVLALGKYPFPHKAGVVPGSDGAGIVVAVGKRVSRFKVGDKVITTLHQLHIAGNFDDRIPESALGANIDGTFREYGAFEEGGLVRMPECLSFVEAATLSCAGVTAWNALFGLTGKQLSAGQWILTQGTGGVSIFTIQFAKVTGARVIATTSSSDRAEILQRLGADHVINYRTNPEWGKLARSLTGEVGVDMVVDVAGPSTLKQSSICVKRDGLINTVGFVGGEEEGGQIPSLLDTWLNLSTARGVWVGNRLQMEEMCRAVEANPERLRPVVDAKNFTLDKLEEAYKYQLSGKHQGKICIAYQ